MEINSSRLYKYGQKANTHDLLKAIAILFVVIDHVGFYFYPEITWLRVIGRGAAPIFYFLVGYSGKLNCRSRLLIYGCILSISTGFCLDSVFWVNILYTFMIAHLFIKYMPAKTTHHNTKINIFVFLIIANFLTFRYVEYGSLGILIALTANWHINKVSYGAIWLAMSLTAHFLWQGLAFPSPTHEHLLLLLTSMAPAFWVLFNVYQLKDIACPKFLRLLIMALSRYSLEIYFYHLILFQIIYGLYLK